ncbi:MAG: HDOD domain-containing protein [Acidimicrobiia bacterium]
MLKTDDLLKNVTKLPPSSTASVKLLTLLNEDASSSEIGRVIETDPSLTAQVIRLANTPYYGMSRRVASARQAVMVLGFDLVRSLVTNAAFGFNVGRSSGVPEGFWEHSLSSGAAASVLAVHSGYPESEAFSAGLLADLGIALLYRYLGPAYTKLRERAASLEQPLIAAEQEEFGMTHADITAAALERMRFPEELVTVLGRHHVVPDETTSPLGRIVFAAEALAHEFEHTRPEGHLGVTAALEAAGFEPVMVPQLLEAIGRDYESFAGLLVGAA